MPLTQIQLAAALGLSQSAISQLAKQGMPTGSVEAARHWRECNLHPGRAKPAPRAPSLRALFEEAEALLDVGGDIEPLLPDLRNALRQVPADQRAAVAMSETLWDALTAPTDHVFETERGAALTPAEADEMGGFWYALAAGEPWMA
jgi:transcriptional regulator with XRE-family HTH domain